MLQFVYNKITDTLKKRSPLCLVMIGLIFQACIKNDIPYPTVKLRITELDFEGQIGTAYIDAEERTVTVNLSEDVDLSKVEVKNIAFTDGARSDVAQGSTLDLRSPHQLVLSLYQEYTWTIIAKQQIDRHFEVANQIGEAVFDPVSRRAVVSVSSSANLKRITIKNLKLAPAGSVIEPSDLLIGRHDFRQPLEVTVSYRGIKEQWMLYVIQPESPVTIKQVIPWVNVARLYAEGEESGNRGFEIREANQADWTRVDPANIEFSGTSFTACVPHLKAETSYLVRAYLDDTYGEEHSFVTGRGIPLTDGSFDNWHKLKAVWNPWLDTASSFWDTGNKGSATLGQSNTLPTEDIWSGKTSGKAASLESRFVGIGSVGKFAAGNLFVGQFLAVDGTNGILEFGRPFNSYPTRLKGYYKYNSAPISHASEEFKHLIGKTDTCTVYIALGDWSAPVEIRTNPRDRKLFDKNDPHIIAYAEFNSGTTVSEYQELSLELDYRSMDRKPTYLVVVASASKYGDYFTGGIGTILALDEFRLEYDY